ncbi:hypothetical protein BSLG_008102 [Batrachochytrium salamandrivorans]|nr:hypothetical protein BSLG_008102 [Batrachochytrium salamandrivorans]
MDANSRPNWAQSLGSPTELSQLSADDMDGATPRFESIHQQIDHIFPTATIAHSHGHNQSHPRRKQQHLPHAWEIHDLPQRPNIYSQQQRVAVEMPLPLSPRVEGKTEPQLKISSLELLFTSRLSIPFNAHFSVLKIVNINWDLTTQDVLVFFGEPQTHPSRKCPRRPFENIISILAKVPWHRANLIPILQRDHLFEMEIGD